MLSVDEGGFSMEVEGRRVRGLVMAVATGEEVARAADGGAEFVAASVFTQDAAEAAKRRGVMLINVEDILEPLSILVVRLITERRADLLFRAFDGLAPRSFARYVNYMEFFPFEGDVEGGSRNVTISFTAPPRAPRVVIEGMGELLSRLAARLNEAPGVATEFTTKKTQDGRHELSIKISLDPEKLARRDLREELRRAVEAFFRRSSEKGE